MIYKLHMSKGEDLGGGGGGGDILLKKLFQLKIVVVDPGTIVMSYDNRFEFAYTLSS